MCRVNIECKNNDCIHWKMGSCWIPAGKITIVRGGDCFERKTEKRSEEEKQVEEYVNRSEEVA